jgi:hypothetical protein
VSSGSLRACRGKRHPDAMEEKPLAACRPDFGSLACLLARLGGACRALDSRELGGEGI